MTNTHQRLLGVLRRYLSSVNSEVVLSRALRECSIRPEHFSVREVPALISRLENGIRLFVPSDRQQALKEELESFVGRGDTADKHSIPVMGEEDISRARMLARNLAEDFGATASSVQKVATIVSELARNIVSYTSGGNITVSVVDGSPRKIRIQASDRGPGVANLNQIMAGEYKSKTGLGKGLTGVKRLAHRFDIQTDDRGTLIDVWVWI
jgi:serine/threonine-protein kinase RsbT